MNKEDVEEIKNILKKIEENTRKPSAAMEAKAFNTWLSQYEPDVDISDEGALRDPEPYVPVAACSNEAMAEAIKAHREWEERNLNKFSISDYRIK